ncbi:FN3 associated domain-containing protein [Desulfofalx alkaliphila]|uniref:FN3 associated domain-containing protein n=1 Tax=Desulfofalx alkaliphila TaxID=105483 RepID=UPI0004E12976|nr:FN3 associated domain-containing protein [Desulfofalx alkaliphila]
MRIHKNFSLLGALLFSGLLFLVCIFALLTPQAAYAVGGSITITGDGVYNPGVTFTQDELRNPEVLPQHTELYSTINTWPTKYWYKGTGVKVSDLLEAAGGIKPEATLIKFSTRDGFSTTFTVSEFVYRPRYSFPNFMNNGIAGHIPGDSNEAVPVEPIIAWKSCYGQSLEAVADDQMTFNDANHLLFGQRAVTEQTNAMFAKYVTTIEVLTTEPDKWDSPTAVPNSGEVPLGTMVKLQGPDNDLDKVHYTLDGSTPTVDSPMYNWVASRWSWREDFDAVNHPIEINENTIIKAVVIGPGKRDSDIVTFEYQVADVADPGLVINKINLAKATINKEYRHTFTATGGVQPYTFAVTDGVLPKGMSLNGATLQGTPTETGTFTFTVTVTDSADPFGADSHEFVLEVGTESVLPPSGDVVLTIKGDGVTTTKEFTMSQLENMPQYQSVYSVINTWPSKSWYVGKGVKVRDLLTEAGLKGNAQQIRFRSSDGYYTTLTVQELLRDRRYRFPNFMSGGNEGHIRGSSSGAVEVEPIVALVSAEGTDNPSLMTQTNALQLMIGQRAVTEQTGPLFAKYVNEIEVLTSTPAKWDTPQADPGGGMLPSKALVKLFNNNMDIDKIHYTIDGSTPTVDSPMYNWISSRWWSQRGEETVAGINHPIELTKDTTIKAVTIGPGRLNSDIATFTYKVIEVPSTVTKSIIPSIGGTVSLGDRVTIEIPAGAMTGKDPLEVKIDRVITPPAAPEGFKFIDHVYRFSVGDNTSYEFDKKVTIKINFDAETVSAGGKPAIYYYDEIAERWFNIDGKISGNTVMAQVDHCITFAVMVVDKFVAAETIIPNKGGTVSFGDEVAIKIPAGALVGTDPVEVAIERVIDTPATPKGFSILGCVYQFSVAGKTNYNFNKSVTVELGFDPEKIKPNENPTIHYYDETEEKWINIGGEVNGNIITVQVDHCGKFAVMVAKEWAQVIILTIGQLEATIDGSTYALDAAPYVNSQVGRAMVPARFVVEMLGGEVEWLAETQQVLISDGNKEIILILGSNNVLVNGEKQAIDCAPTMLPPGRTFVPLRFVCEAMGLKVDYQADTGEITIVSGHGG